MLPSVVYRLTLRPRTKSALWLKLERMQVGLKSLMKGSIFSLQSMSHLQPCHYRRVVIREPQVLSLERNIFSTELSGQEMLQMSFPVAYIPKGKIRRASSKINLFL